MEGLEVGQRAQAHGVWGGVGWWGGGGGPVASAMAKKASDTRSGSERLPARRHGEGLAGGMGGGVATGAGGGRGSDRGKEGDVRGVAGATATAGAGGTATRGRGRRWIRRGSSAGFAELGPGERAG